MKATVSPKREPSGRHSRSTEDAVDAGTGSTAAALGTLARLRRSRAGTQLGRIFMAGKTSPFQSRPAPLGLSYHQMPSPRLGGFCSSGEDPLHVHAKRLGPWTDRMPLAWDLWLNAAHYWLPMSTPGRKASGPADNNREAVSCDGSTDHMVVLPSRAWVQRSAFGFHLWTIVRVAPKGHSVGHHFIFDYDLATASIALASVASGLDLQ